MKINYSQMYFKLCRVYRKDNLNKFKLLNVFRTLNK